MGPSLLINNTISKVKGTHVAAAKANVNINTPLRSKNEFLKIPAVIPELDFC